MVNASDRCEAMNRLSKTKFSISKVDLAFNYEELYKTDGRKLDKVYEFDPIGEIRSENPRIKLEH